MGEAEFLTPDGTGTGKHRRTSFAGADLRGADLTLVDIEQAITTGADMTDVTLGPLEES